MTDWGEALQKWVPDHYDLRARVYPMLVLLFPVLLSFWAIVPERMYDWEAVAGLAGWCGMAFLLKEMGREGGKNKEKNLWNGWGGAPTTQYLRHRGETNRATLKRVHKHLGGIVPDIEMPTPEFEAAHPCDADAVYEECTRVIRNKTRDHKEYPLVFKELCSYGFWRNLWGVKLWGVVVSFVCILGVGIGIFLQWRTDHCLKSWNPIISEAANVGMLLFWLTVNEKRIRVSAFAYAARLFETTEDLAGVN